MPTTSSIRQRIDWVLFQEPTTLREMVTELRSESIEVVVPSGKVGDPHGYIYVDHRNKAAVTGQTLGQAYTAEAIFRTLSQGRDQAPGRTQGHALTPTDKQVSIEGAEFNTRVPQILSALFQSQPDPNDYRHGQDQHFGYRQKR